MLLDRFDLFGRNSALSSPSRVSEPKVPSRWWRPGAAGDLRHLGGVRRRRLRPSNLVTPAKATWLTSMLRPIPIASVATR
jgi:hypothetical protein